MNMTKRWAIVATLACAMGLGFGAYGQETWDGGGADDNLSTALNWLDDTAPANPPAGADAQWIFAGLTRPTPNAAVAFTGLQSLSFMGTTAGFTVGGMGLTFDAAAPTTISNLDNQINTINNDITLGANPATFTANNVLGAALIFGGTIDVNGQALTLTTVNALDIIQFNGTLNLNGGTIASMGPGTVQFGPGATFNLDSPGAPVIADNYTFLGAATLTMTQAATLSGTLTTAGGGAVITRDGAGMLTLTGDSSATFMAADTLTLNAGTTRIGDAALGGFIGGSVIVNAGATLQGADPNTADGTRNIGGTLTANAGATVDAGNSVGTLTVGGLYTLNAGAIQMVEVDPTVAGFAIAGTPGTHDIVNAGTATVDDGAIFMITGSTTGFVAANDDIEVIEAGAVPMIAGGGSLATLTGNIVDDNPFVSWTASVAGNNVLLTAARASYTTDPANTTFNRTQTSLGLDALALATPQGSNNDAETLLAAMDALGGTAGFGSALDNLSPERYDVINRVNRRVTQRVTEVQNDYLFHRQAGMPYAGASVVSLDRSLYGEDDGAVDIMFASTDEQFVMLAVADAEDDWGDPKEWQTTGRWRPDDHSDAKPKRRSPYSTQRERAGVEGAPFNVWGTGIYIETEDDSTPTRTGYDAETGGVLLGADWQVTDELLIGVSGGFTATDVDYRSLGGEVEDNTARIGMYGAWTPAENVNITFALGYGIHSYDSTRPILVGGLAARNAQADWTGHEFTGFAGIDVDLASESHIVIAPFAGTQYVYLFQESFTESGAMAANLVVDDQETHSMEVSLGAKVSYAWDVSPTMVVVPDGRIAYRHEALNDQDEDITARFTLAGANFVNERGDTDEGAVEVGGGTSVLLGSDLSLFARYTGVFYEDGTSTVLSGGVTLRF